jgi:hypothetical protein
VEGGATGGELAAGGWAQSIADATNTHAAAQRTNAVGVPILRQAYELVGGVSTAHSAAESRRSRERDVTQSRLEHRSATDVHVNKKSSGRPV